MLRIRSVVPSGGESVGGTLRSKEEEKQQSNLGASSGSKDRFFCPFFSFLLARWASLQQQHRERFRQVLSLNSLFSLFSLFLPKLQFHDRPGVPVAYERVLCGSLLRRHLKRKRVQGTKKKKEEGETSQMQDERRRRRQEF